MSLYDRTLDATLQTLAEAGVHGTFFCVGQMAKHFPEVIRKIVAAGHEIGCHSNVHTWLNKLTQEECMEDTRVAVDELEQCVGRKVVSYRAPAFSITEKNPWAFEVLAANGIQYDASVFPVERDFGGYRDFGSNHPCIVSCKGMEIKEFPICPAEFFGHAFVYSGGGYFRVLPETLIRRKLRENDYAMFYFHIRDLASVKCKFLSQAAYEDYYKEKGTFLRRLKRYLKNNLVWGDTFEKFKSVVKNTDFHGLADSVVDWEKACIIQLQ